MTCITLPTLSYYEKISQITFESFLSLFSGWFGRGQAGSTAASKYADNNTHYVSQPAKKQKDFIDPKKYHVEGANEYNIWYDRYVGDIKDNSALREPAEDRCVVDRDAGYTKADKGKQL